MALGQRFERPRHEGTAVCATKLPGAHARPRCKETS
jgi:hypothetical protein